MKLCAVLLALVTTINNDCSCNDHNHQYVTVTPEDPYHDLHLHRDPPIYPAYRAIPESGFTCIGLRDQLWADFATECQGYHLCINQRLVMSQLCTNGTLFNQQFQVCDQFYNVRCGNPYGDL